MKNHSDRLQVLRDCCRDDAAFETLKEILVPLAHSIPENHSQNHHLPSGLAGKLLTGIAEATKALLTRSDFTEGIDAALAILGRYTGVDRVYIFKVHPHPDTGEPAMSQRFEWVSAIASPQLENLELQNLPFATYEMSDLYQSLIQGQAMSGLVEEFPPQQQALLAPQNIISILIVPIPVAGELWGFIGFDDCHQARIWSIDEEAVLRTIGATIGGAIAHRKTEYALRESQRRFQRLASNIPGVIYQFLQHPNQQQSMPFISSGCRELFGLEPEAIQADLSILTNLIHPEDYPSYQESVATSAATLQPLYRQTRMFNQTGELKWFLCAARPELLFNGCILWDGLLIDITERKQAEEDLKKTKLELELRVEERTKELSQANIQLQREIQERRTSEGKYRELVENANSIILRLDTQGNIVFFNEFAQSFFGYSESEILGQPAVGSIVPATDYAGRNLSETIQNLLTDPDRYCHNENENIRRNDERVWVSWTNKAILDSAGNLAGVLCIGNDITYRVRAESALQKSEARYRAIVEDQTELVCRFLADGSFTFVNDAYCRYFGVERSHLMGLSFLWLIPDPQQRQEFQDKLAALDRDRPVITIEHQSIVHGQICWHQWTNRAIFDALGQFVEFQAVGRDITPLKQAQAALQEANTELEHRVQQRTAALTEVNRQLRVEIAERQQAEANVRESERCLRRQNKVLVELAKSPLLNGGDLNAAVGEITEAAARTLDVARVSVWLYKNGSATMECLDLYESFANIHSRGMEFSAAAYPDYFQALNQERTIAAHDAHRDPRTCELSASYLQPLGVTSMLDAPVRLRGEIVGVVCHEHIGEMRQWAVEEENFAGSIADFVSLALEARDRAFAEAALARSEQWYRTLIQNATDMLKVMDEQGIYRYVSPACEAITGYSCDAIAQMRFWDLLHPEDLPKAQTTFQQVLENPGVPVCVTLRTRHREGRWLYEEITSRNLLHDPVVQGIAINSRDITERYLAEEALARSEAWFKALIQGSTDMIDVLDRNGNYLYASPSTQLIMGVSPAILIGKPCWEFVHPEDLPFAQATFEKILQNPGKPLQLTLRVRHQQQDWVYIEVSARNFLDHPAVQGIVLNSRDVNDRKQAEAALLQAKDQLQAVLDAVPGCISWISADLRYLGVNRYLTQILGMSPEDFSGQSLGFMGSASQFYQFVVNFFASDAQESSQEIQTNSGNNIQHYLVVAQKYQQGEAAVFVGIDISERKNFEEALRVSEDKFSKAFRSSPDSLTISTLSDGRYIDVNETFLRITGYTREEVIGYTAFELNIWVNPEDRDRMKQMLQENGVVYNQEFAFRTKFGDIRIGLLSAEIITLNGDLCLVVVTNDITERKYAEERLKESEAQYRAIFEATTDGLILNDLEGYVLEANPAACQMHGYRYEEFIGLYPTTFIHPDYHNLIEPYMESIKNGGSFETFAYDLRKDGSAFPVEVKGTAFTSKGKPHLLAIIRDITERKQAEEALREQARLEALRADTRLALSEQVTLPQHLQWYAQALVRHLDAAMSCIWTLNAEENALELQGSGGELTLLLNGCYDRVTLDDKFAPTPECTQGFNLLREITRARQPYLTNQVCHDLRFQDVECAIADGMVAFAGYPLLVEDRFVGVMAMFSRQPLTDATLAELASIAEAIALNIERKRAEARLEAAAERDRLLGKIALRIRRSIEVEQILATTVAEVRHFLQADRVLVGYLGSDLRGKVMAESVAPNRKSCLGLSVADDHYLEEISSLFQETDVQAIEDTTLMDRSSARSRFLQEYEVRAALGVPILLGDRVFGLLVAHQCSGPRQWQPLEIELLRALATQVAIAIQQGQLYQQLSTANANLEALNANLEEQVKERTAQLQQKMQELQELNQLKDVFLHAVSHDLRTPVMGMLMVLNNLLKTDEQKLQETETITKPTVCVARTVLERMIQSSDRQLQLINSLLEVHASEVQGVILHLESVAPTQLIRNILEELEPLLTKNQATLSLDVPENLPIIDADPTAIWRIFENLMTNALKHNPPGIHLHVSAQVENQMIRCAIADNGVGMTQQQCDRLFDLYYRGASSRHLTGIGLGLYLCRQIVNAHGGEIAAVSCPGSGATFYFTLPIAVQN